MTSSKSPFHSALDPATLDPATSAAQALGEVDPVTRAIIPALHPSTTYIRDEDNQYRTGRVYARPHNPTFEPAEALLTALEKGAASLLFASGMAAATAVFLALKPGDHVVAARVMYWALRHWLKTVGTDWGLDVEFVDMTDADALAAAVRPGKTRLVWAETPANPTWEIVDIARTAEIAHAAGALLAVDGTIASPVLSQPLTLGADLVMHSATKYLNGHSDVLAGTLTTARTDAFWERLKTVRGGMGGVIGPFEAWLLQRGMRTLFVRVERASANAQHLAEHFAGRPDLVAEVLYPGLPSFRGHKVAARQMQGGFGGMLSIRVAAGATGGEAAAIATAARTQLWKRATSLGGVESLIEHRQSIEGTGSPAAPDLLRLSTGIENVGDLIDDLEQALTAAVRG